MILQNDIAVAIARRELPAWRPVPLLPEGGCLERAEGFW
jgi:hypothetical protein